MDKGVGTGHALLAYLFAGLIALHVLAALKHQFIQKDGGIGRVLPGRRARPEPAPLPGESRARARGLPGGAGFMYVRNHAIFAGEGSE